MPIVRYDLPITSHPGGVRLLAWIKAQDSRSPLLSEWICSISIQIIRQICCPGSTRPEGLAVLSVCTVPLFLVIQCLLVALHISVVC